MYAVAGQQAQADRQYALIGAIEKLYRANGVNVDLQMALFLADHDQNIGEAVQQALAVHGAQTDSIYAADAVAFSSAQWMARGMNSVTATNHLMGEATGLVVAIEALCAAQALDLRAPLQPSIAARAVVDAVRARVPTLTEDRALAPDIEAVTAMVRDGESVLGALPWQIP